MSFLVVGLNPVIQKTLSVESFREDQVNGIRWSRTDVAGQGANTTRILHQLGEYAVNLCQIGDDDGHLFLSLTRAEGLSVEAIAAPGGIRNCHTILDEGTGEITELVEEGIPVTPDVERLLRLRFLKLMPHFEWVILTGSKAPGFSDQILPDMVEEARRGGKRVGLDIRGSDLKNSLPHHPDLVKINVPELVATFFTGRRVSEHDIDAEDEELIRDTLSSLSREHRTVFAVTHGKNPSFLAVAGDVQRVSTQVVAVKNTIGCGDSATAGTAAGLHRGNSPVDALLLGHDCAARNAQVYKPGSLHES